MSAEIQSTSDEPPIPEHLWDQAVQADDEPIVGVVVSHPIPGPPIIGFDLAGDSPPVMGRFHGDKITLHHWGRDYPDTDEGQPVSSAHFVVSKGQIKKLPDGTWEDIGFTDQSPGLH